MNISELKVSFKSVKYFSCTKRRFAITANAAKLSNVYISEKHGLSAVVNLTKMINAGYIKLAILTYSDL